MNARNKIGIFEAKTHFSQLCDQVNRSGQSMLVERRGKALVVIAPVPPNPSNNDGGILSAWKKWASEHPEDTTDFPDVTRLRNSKGTPVFES